MSGMTRRFYWMQALLFLSAYGCFLVYFAVVESHGSGASLPGVARLPHVDTPSAGFHSSASLGKSMSRRQPTDVADVHTEAAQPAAASDAPDAGEEERRRELERWSEAGAQAVTAGDPEQRGGAVDVLADAEATPEALQALQTAATSDSIPMNRMRAVTSLLALAGRKDAADAVLPILSQAMNDPDSRVASHASRAYQELSGEASAQ